MRDRIIITGVWRVYPNRGIAFNSHNGNAAYFRTTESGIAVWGINVPAMWMLKELAEWVVKTMMPNKEVRGAEQASLAERPSRTPGSAD